MIFDDKGEEGVQKGPKLYDVIYEQPLNSQFVTKPIIDSKYRRTFCTKILETPVGLEGGIYGRT